MKTRTVRSKPNISQEEALLSLQKLCRSKGEEMTSFRRQANLWVADLQKVAEFPPSDEGGEEKPPKKAPAEGPDEGPEVEEGPPMGDDEGDEGGPPVDPAAEGAEGAKGEEKGELHELLSLITQMAQAMGIHPHSQHHLPTGDSPMPPPPPGPGGPGGPMDGPPGGPGGGPPGMLGSSGKEGQLPTKLRPGEVLPHQTPIGAPAFAKKRTMTAKSNVRMSAAQFASELTAAYGPLGYAVGQMAAQPDGTIAALLIAE